jgi:hypothetical protein
MRIAQVADKDQTGKMLIHLLAIKEQTGVMAVYNSVLQGGGIYVPDFNSKGDFTPTEIETNDAYKPGFGSSGEHQPQSAEEGAYRPGFIQKGRY